MRNRMRLLCVSNLLFAFIYLHAENKLFLCTGYDKDGNSTGDFANWEISKAGNFMYILYKSTEPIDDSLYVNIEKTFSRRDTALYQYDHYYLVPDISKKWAVNKYIFSKPGNYKISVYKRNSEELLQSYSTNIDYTMNEYTDAFFTDSWYYNQARIYFCDSVGTGDSKLLGEKEVFKYQPERKNITLYIEQQNKRNFKTGHLYIRIYSRDNYQLVKTSSYAIDPKWFWTFIPIYLSHKGKYTVELYNEDDVYINKGDVEIK